MFNFQWGWFQSLCLKIISQGRMPNHIGIILDGNRRFAKKAKLPSTLEGHRRGYDKVDEVVGMMLSMGIREITLYAFSIENFKRSQEEVDWLMELIGGKVDMFLANMERLHRVGICIEVVGDWDRVPEMLKSKMARLMVLTRGNSRMKLNMAFVYTARNEITTGVKTLIVELSRGNISVHDISETMLEGCFRLHRTTPMDLLIRTSGECRLSDFLLWQGAESVLNFVDVTWPEFTWWDLLQAILQYQANVWRIKEILGSGATVTPLLGEEGCDWQSEQDRKAIEGIRRRRWEVIEVCGAAVKPDGIRSNGA